MEPDGLLGKELRRRRDEIAARDKERLRAWRQLQLAGQEAYAALQAAGYKSEVVARALKVSAGTIRKLKTDGDREGWKPPSREFYFQLDEFTRTRLQRSWNLTALRDDYDQALGALATARQRLEAAAAQVDGARPSFDLGVLFIPGLPGPRAVRALRQFGDALAGSFATEGDGRGPGTSVQVADAALEAGGVAPAQLALRRRPRLEGGEGGGAGARADDRDGARDGGGERVAASGWLVAVSPVDHGLADEQDLREFLGWLCLTLPWFAADALDRGLTQARCQQGGRLRRWSRTASTRIAGFVGVQLLALALVLLLVCLGALYLPGFRAAGRPVARLLLRGFGLTFSSVRSQVVMDAQVNRAVRDLDWLSRCCGRLVVVAQGQATPIAERLVRRIPAGTVALLATMGSPLRRFRFARALRDDPPEGLDGAGGLLAWFLAALVRLAIVLGFTPLLVLLVVQGNWRFALFAAGSGGALLAGVTVYDR